MQGFNESEFAMKLYGIPNCTTVKKARAWLEERDIPYEFHDFKKLGVPAELMMKLMGSMGWEALVNRSGPTWRKLPDATRAKVKDAKTALAVMQEHSSIIKRPIAERNDQYQLGFSEDNYAVFFRK